MVVEVEKSQKCPACGTPLSRGRWSEGLCPSCVFELALDDTGLEAELLLEPDEAPTLQFSAEGFSEGDIHGERYRIRSLLGRGGMGEVWRAYDLKLRQDVALKALRTELVEDQAALEILRQEVRVAREVISPNVCRVFDLQELEAQELISMEYVDGTTLQEILRDRGPLELNEAREIATQFLAGLEAIHDAGLVHRDIKPENLMITRTGRVVVMDFGIAKGLGEGKSGVVAGTPAYMSPEQARGGELEPQADLFSAGVVLAEMVEPGGIGTFEGRKLVWEGIHQTTPQISETPWSNVIAKAVSAETRDRFESAAALARALEEVTLRAAGDETARPYPGLSAFQQEDAEYFYGRELEVEALWKKLRRPHLLAVIGPSGAGKSSFLRAGLLPTLTDGWQALITTPGNHPFANLARALSEQLPEDRSITDALLRFEEPEVALGLIRQWSDRHQHILIILDQFEELFTQNPDDTQRAFAELLGRLPLEADVFVLLSMRDDFLFYCQAFESLAPVFSAMTPLGPPTGASLRRAIIEPALKCGYRFEYESIVEEMLGEVEGQRGALPLLAFAAAQLWERRDRESGLLTEKAYEQIGGVSGALAQHAEAMLDYIGEANAPIVRELFRNLVTAQGTRASRDREELLSVFPETEGEPFLEPSKVRPTPAPKPQRPAAKRVLNSLVDARLLTSYEIPADEENGEPQHQIEIVHESLLARWPRLVRWQRQDADSAQMRDELRSQAKLWDEHGRSQDYLWTGTAFKEYALWRESYPGGLTEVEDAFGAAMVRLAERQKRRRRVAITAAFTILLAVLGVIGWFGWQAEQERRRAEAGKLLALGEVELDTYPTATLAWATKSLELADTLEGRMLALRALQESPPALELGNAEGGKSRWWGAEFSPSGEWLAHEGVGNLWLLHRDGGEPSILARDPSFAYAQKFAFRSDEVLVVQKGAEYRWLEVPDGEELRRVEGDRGELLWPRGDGYFSFEGADGQGSIYWWPFEEGEGQLVGTMADWRAAVIEAGAMAWESPEWSPEWSAIDIDSSGTWIAYSRERTIFLRSLEAWDRPPLEIGEHKSNVTEITFQADGDLLAATDEAGELRVWAGRERPRELLRTYQAEGLNGIRFDPSGRLLAAHGVVDGTATARLWDLTAPQDAAPLSLDLAGRAVFANELTFHPHEPWLVTSHTNSAAFWPLPEEHPRVLRGHEGRVEAVAFTPDGEWLLSAAGDGVRAWPLRGQNHGAARVLLARSLVAFTHLVIHPSGESVAVGSRDGTVLLVPLHGGPVRELPGRWPVEGGGMRIAFSPDGRRLAAVPWWVAEGESIIRVWNLATGAVQTLDPDLHPTPSTRYLTFDDDQRLRWGGSTRDPLQQTEDVERIFDLEDGSVSGLSKNRFFFGETPSHDRTFVIGVEIAGTAGQKSEVVRVDLETGDRRRILTHGDVSVKLAIDPSDRWIATGDTEGMVRVGPVSGEEPHAFFGHRGFIRSVAISPDGRWIASGSEDGTIRVWPKPDLSKLPLHTLPHDELLAKLKSLTNLRIVEDPASASGWTIDYDPFPGWAEVPAW